MTKAYADNLVKQANAAKNSNYHPVYNQYDAMQIQKNEKQMVANNKTISNIVNNGGSGSGAVQALEQQNAQLRQQNKNISNNSTLGGGNNTAYKAGTGYGNSIKQSTVTPFQPTGGGGNGYSSSVSGTTLTVNTNTDPLMLRAAPNGQVMTQMPKGSKVKLISADTGSGWSLVEYTGADGKTYQGYAFTGYLKSTGTINNNTNTTGTTTPTDGGKTSDSKGTGKTGGTGKTSGGSSSSQEYLNIEVKDIKELEMMMRELYRWVKGMRNIKTDTSNALNVLTQNMVINDTKMNTSLTKVKTILNKNLQVMIKDAQAFYKWAKKVRDAVNAAKTQANRKVSSGSGTVTNVGTSGGSKSTSTVTTTTTPKYDNVYSGGNTNPYQSVYTRTDGNVDTSNAPKTTTQKTNTTGGPSAKKLAEIQTRLDKVTGSNTTKINKTNTSAPVGGGGGKVVATTK